MWIRNVTGRPVIVDVSWFISILAVLRREKSSCYQRNGSTCTSLPPNHLLLTKNSISDMCAGLGTVQVISLLAVYACIICFYFLFQMTNFVLRYRITLTHCLR